MVVVSRFISFVCLLHTFSVCPMFSPWSLKPLLSGNFRCLCILRHWWVLFLLYYAHTQTVVKKCLAIETFVVYDLCSLNACLAAFSSCLTRIWPEFDQNLTKNWPTFDQNLTTIWSKFDQNLTRIWPEFDQHLTKIWPKFNQFFY